ncbi:hypothetical protein ACIQB5_42480 [Streptomyces sp. NPDC088560]
MEYRSANDEAAGKEARHNLRELAKDGLIVRADPDQAAYRLA